MMNKLIVSFVILLAHCIVNLPPMQAQAQLFIVSPSGGEKIQCGSTYEIQWQSIDVHGTVDISLWNAKTNQFSLIATRLKIDDRKFLWSVPYFSPNAWYRVKIHSTSQPHIYAMSPSFFSLQHLDTTGNSGTYTLNPNVSVQVVPNPVSSGSVTFTWTDTTPISLINILDINGTIIESLSPSTAISYSIRYVIPPELSSGVYPIHYVFTDGTIKSSRMIVLR